MSHRNEGARVLLFLAGLGLAGYGALILLQVLAHESRIIGGLLLAFGGLLALLSGRGRTDAPAPQSPSLAPGRRGLLVALLGLLAAGGVLSWNLLRGSSLDLPELAILAYGAALLAAAPFVSRPRVSAAVAWSFPLLAAPLGIYAVDAALTTAAAGGSSPIDGFIAHGLVAPLGAVLALFGFEAATAGQTVFLETPRGLLVLGVGLVCAGLQPAVLFLGVFGMHAWEERTPPARFALLLGLGLLGVYVANLIRLVALALVGYQWGGVALQEAHAHLGWILFVAWMLLYWWLVLRRFTGPSRAREGEA
ncbi:MAG TPA: exosortase/archaeosortase family protein [Candidatus Thermoplasmatota archaeon]|nr:exosortase/archaeosortase family protein [Candidatus Thermoplasmatota archaeon]